METRNEAKRRIEQKRAARRRRRITKYIIPRALLALAIVATLCVLIACMSNDVSGKKDTTAAETTAAETAKTETEARTETSKEPAAFYELTADERDLIEQVVSAESRGEPYDGQVAVAQCILNGCLKEGVRPAAILKKYHYTTARVTPTDSVRKAVAAVFDRGEGVTDEPIIYFYNPHLCTSEFHESQIFVIEIQNHRFFKEAQ